jgi:NADPH2:quinone reductase
MLQAASIPVVYGTSHHALTAKARLQAGEVLLVHGAAGGVGLTAVQIGKRLGATVIATAGGAAKLDIARQHGADHLVDYRSEDIRERVKELTGGRGADVVYDPVGGDVFKASLRCTAPDGRILLIGFASGDVPQIPANILLVKNITCIGYNWGAYRQIDPGALERSFAQLLGWIAEGSLVPHVSMTFALADYAQAYAALIERRSTGKVVLSMV